MRMRDLIQAPTRKNFGLLGVVIIWGSLLVASVSVGALLRDINYHPDPWGRFATPTLVGVWDGDVLVTTSVDDQRYPIAPRIPEGGDALYEVPLVFSRCGPDDQLFLRSRRTWAVEWQVSGELLETERIEGEVIDFASEATPECFLFQAYVKVPDKVVRFAEEHPGPGTQITLTLVVEAVGGEAYASVPVETEPFVLDVGQPSVEIERVVSPLRS